SRAKAGEIRYLRAKPPSNVETIQVRQLAVQEYDRGWVLRSEPQGRLTILGVEDRISLRSERKAHHLPRRRVVLDDEDRGDTHGVTGCEARCAAITPGKESTSMGLAM